MKPRHRVAFAGLAFIASVLVGHNAYAVPPYIVNEGTPFGDTAAACGYAMQLGKYGATHSYNQVVNFGSGAGCRTFNVSVNTNLGDDFRFLGFPGNGVWLQALAPGQWYSTMTFVQPSNLCQRRTYYAPQWPNQGYTSGYINTC